MCCFHGFCPLDRPELRMSSVADIDIAGADWSCASNSARAAPGRQVAQVLNTVRGFGLNFYSEDLEADYQALHSDELANELHQAGLAQNSGASSS